MAVEVEIKLSLPDISAAGRILSDPRVASMICGNILVCEMDSIYYDTPSRMLRALEWGLRLRRENGKGVAALKTKGESSGAMTSRGEWQSEAEDIDSGAAALIAVGAPQELSAALREGLMPVCGVRFTRRHVRLMDGGSVYDLALDSGEFIGARSERFSELELELESGNADDMRLLADGLALRFGLVPELRSKLERALLLAE